MSLFSDLQQCLFCTRFSRSRRHLKNRGAVAPNLTSFRILKVISTCGQPLVTVTHAQFWSRFCCVITHKCVQEMDTDSSCTSTRILTFFVKPTAALIYAQMKKAFSIKALSQKLQLSSFSVTNSSNTTANTTTDKKKINVSKQY